MSLVLGEGHPVPKVKTENCNITGRGGYGANSGAQSEMYVRFVAYDKKNINKKNESESLEKKKKCGS